MCNKCNKKGHLARACRGDNANARKSTEIQKLTASDESLSQIIDHERDFFSIKQNYVAHPCNVNKTENTSIYECIKNKQSEAFTGKNCKSDQQNEYVSELYNHASKISTGSLPMYVILKINGKNIKFEIDTGTFAAVISEKTYKEFFDISTIMETDKDLRAYGGQSLVPLGELTDLEVTYHNITRKLKCFVLPWS